MEIVSWWSRLRIGRVLGQGGFSIVQVRATAAMMMMISPWGLLLPVVTQLAGSSVGGAMVVVLQEMEDSRTGELFAVKRIEARTRMERDQVGDEEDCVIDG